MSAATGVGNGRSKSAQIRARLNHPIIDSDGHTIENEAVLTEYIASVAGRKVAARYEMVVGSARAARFGGRSLEEARDLHVTRGPWWGIAARNTRDRATAMLPKL